MHTEKKQMTVRYLKILNRIILLVLLLLSIWMYFSRNNYKSVDNIHLEVIKEPIQTEAKSKEPIRFIKDEYQYELKPLFDYEVSAMIVHKMDYRWFSIYKMDSVFPVDLILLWGDNVKNRVYQDKSVKFSQDGRFGYWRWGNGIKFNNDEVANTHLIVKDSELERKVKTLINGDQLRIKGQLVEVNAKNSGKPGKYDPASFSLKSSIVRNDTGAGACEIINVDSLEILEKANIMPDSIFKISFTLLIIMVFLNILFFFLDIFRGQN